MAGLFGKGVQVLPLLLRLLSVSAGTVSFHVKGNFTKGFIARSFRK